METYDSKTERKRYRETRRIGRENQKEKHREKELEKKRNNIRNYLPYPERQEEGWRALIPLYTLSPPS